MKDTIRNILLALLAVIIVVGGTYTAIQWDVIVGKWVYQGTCVGYGIPYGASITNPEQRVYSGLTLPLAEPNGLYTNGLSTSATWILTTDAKGNIMPTYVESEITISQSKMDARLCEDWSIPSDY